MLKNQKTRLIIYGLLGALLLGKYLVSPDKTAEELYPKYAASPSKFMELDGRKIHYRDEGEGEVIVLIHGTGASLHTWQAWAEKLRENYRVIRLDLPAYGLTGADPQKRYTSKDYVDLIDLFLTQLNVKKFHIGGNSLGGLVAWLYTTYHQEKVEKLLLLDPSGFPFDATPMVIKLAKTPVLNLFIRYFTPKAFIEKNLKEVYYDEERISQETVDRYYDLALFENNRQAFIDRSYIEREDYTNRIKTIKVPTLILWGAEDAWIPVSDAAKFKAALPQAVVKIMPATGHVPMEERPEESLAIALDFLNN